MLVCDTDNLPKEIKQKAEEYAKQYNSFTILPSAIEEAWLQGFAFCLLGKVKVELKECEVKNEAKQL